MRKDYDLIIVGGGLSGLSLACQIIQGPLRDRSILVVDRDAKTQNDRTWCFWSNQPTLFDPIIYRTWDTLHIKGQSFEQTHQLCKYQYHMIRAIDLYRYAQQLLNSCGTVDFIQGTVEMISDGPDAATVEVGGDAFGGGWVFDSRFHIRSFRPDPAYYHTIYQHFKGWFIETAHDAFDPSAPTLFDFRIPQQNDLRFFYVLPLSKRHALIEYVLHSPDHYDEAVQAYIEKVLGLHKYYITAKEGGTNPLTDWPFPRQLGQHIMSIGTPGGQIKPSSGYAFTRIQQDSAAIVASLVKHGHPFDVTSSLARYRLLDAVLLDVMQHHGGQIASIFAAMFSNNSADNVFRFLDERASALENLHFIATLPPRLFVQTLLQPRWLSAFRRSQLCQQVPQL